MVRFANQHKYDWRFSGQPSGSAYYQAYVCFGVMNRGWVLPHLPISHIRHHIKMSFAFVNT